MGWVKNINTSILTFNIAQFFTFLNHQLLPNFLDKAGFNTKVSKFFGNYLVGKQTKYVWNNFSSHLFSVNVGVGQGSVLSPILFTLYLSLILHILKKWLKSLKIPTSFLSFVNNNLLITQNKSLSISNSFLFCSYQIIFSLFKKFSLKLEHSKTENFHFLHSTSPFNLPSLDLSLLDSSILQQRNIWKYLEFIFDRKLSFWSHINFDINKAMSMVKNMKLLGNSTCGLAPQQKYPLYRSCVLYITLYSHQLWFYNKAPLSYPIRELNKM